MWSIMSNIFNQTSYTIFRHQKFYKWGDELSNEVSNLNKMLNGTIERGGLSLQSSPVKVTTSPVRASPSPVRAPPSPLKSSLASGRKSPRRCQFAAPIEDARDKCGSSWLCRRGAGIGEESDKEGSPGPSAPVSACEESAPPPKNCFRLVMLG